MAAGNWVDWNTGDLVTAASFQDIQDSIVFIYANDSAANTALTNKVEGTAYYNTTDNVLKIWDGAAWTEVGGAGGLTEADEWILTANLTADADPISANISRPSGTLQSYLGTGMSVSSGLWTFPSTGYWLVQMQAHISIDANSTRGYVEIYSTNDNFSTSDLIVQGYVGGNSADEKTFTIQGIIDVQDTANDKVKFRFNEVNTNTLEGSPNQKLTGFNFIKLADT